MRYKIEAEIEWCEEKDLEYWMKVKGFSKIQISPIYSTSEFKNLKKWDK